MQMGNRNERILVIAPVGRDASLVRGTLEKASIAAEIGTGVPDIATAFDGGLGGVVLTQEALTRTSVDQLLRILEAQPPWSDLPLVVLVSGGAPTPASMYLAMTIGRRVNVTFLERPIRGDTLVGAVQAALRGRRRQYELRDQMIKLAEAQEAERQARAVAENAVRVRDEFLASVAHDLKNPLGAIKAFSQLLQRQLARSDSRDPDTISHGLARIDAMVTRTVAQLDELLDVARLQADQPLQLDLRPTDLVALAQRVTAEYQQTTSVHQMRVRTDLATLEGRWDAPRLERILGNLLSNAIKYSPNGGEILVEVRRQDTPQPEALLMVQDHGIGVPKADLPRIFGRFYRASNAAGRLPGTGIGLAGVRQIVEQHGGTIGVASEEGRGSTFTVRLPIRSDSEDHTAAPSGTERAAS